MAVWFPLLYRTFGLILPAQQAIHVIRNSLCQRTTPPPLSSFLTLRPALRSRWVGVFNGLAAAYEFRSQGDDVSIQFQGAGTRWLGVLAKPEHPAHELFQQVKDTVVGASCGCADVFGSAEEVRQSGFDLIKDSPVPGTSGLLSLRRLVLEGTTVLTFLPQRMGVGSGDA